MRESSRDDRWWRRTATSSLPVPADAVAVVGFLVLANAALFAPVAESVVARAALGLPLLFVLPGYALVSALFPGRSTLSGQERDRQALGATGGRSTLLDRGVDWRERVALALGASVTLLPVFAVAMSLAGLGYALDALAATLSGFVVLGMGVAVLRRNRLPAHQRFRLPYDRWIAEVNQGLFVQPSGLDAALNVGLVVVVVASLAGVGYAVAAPSDAETFTGVTLLTEDDGGELVASGYQDALEESNGELVLRLENREDATTSYTVVGELQHVRSTGSALRVVQSEGVLRAETTLDDGEAWTRRHAVEPGLAGDDLRLIYYVYRGEAPADPNVDSADQYVQAWVDVPATATG